MAAPPVDEHRVCIIVGAGISGVLQASEIVRKKVLPYEDFEIIDRCGGYGGVWYANTYPGCACDVQSHIYQISWRKNPDWSHKYAPQEEIQQYWDAIAKDHQLERSTSFHTDVKAASWDEKEMLWVVETENVKTGQKKVWTCNMLISCVGIYSYPKKLDVPGVDSFKRASWHTARWPANADLKGKRVAVIGTGASAAQIIPEIQKTAASMAVYQRSPGHVLSRDNFEFPAWVRWAFRNVPLVMTLYGMFVRKMHGILLSRILVQGTYLNTQVTKVVDKRLKTQVKDEKLQKALTCDYPLGCKRPLIHDDYLPALSAENVELITDPVVALSETGIISRCRDSGVEHEREVDVLVWGTGFHHSVAGTIFPASGRGGVSLMDHVGPDMYWLYGLAVDEFPNFLSLFGPGSISIPGSVIETADRQALYNIQVIEYVLKLNRSSFRRAVMPRRDVTVKWVESLRPGQNKLTASDPRCVSNIKNEKGVIFFYPYHPDKYNKQVEKPDFENNYVMLSIRAGMEEAQITDCLV